MKKLSLSLLGLLFAFSFLFVSCSDDEDDATPGYLADTIIDLGLQSGLKWASFNVGATVPEESGNYYAWGETREKDLFCWSTYEWCNGTSNTMTKYCVNPEHDFFDNKTILEAENDAAYLQWGPDWRMPRWREIEELVENCTWVWTALNGVNGYKVTGPNGNSIFLPYAGYSLNGVIADMNDKGFYWSASLNGSREDYANSLDMYGNYFFKPVGSNRSYGYTIRPVSGEYKLKVSVLSAGNGNVNIKGISDKSAYIKYESNVAVSAVAEDKYKFYAWYNGDVLISKESEFTFSLNDRMELVAKFVVEGVDLGLPSGIEWAPWNVGATAPEEYGGYYAWGETEEKDKYDWGTYKWCDFMDNTPIFDKYIDEHQNTLAPEDDVAHVKWGGDWRMPTNEEQKELFEKCTWEWTSFNDVNGYQVTGPNGNSIFLPAAGFIDGEIASDQGTLGGYWSSSLKSDNSSNASYFSLLQDTIVKSDYKRSRGFSVRPVCNK